MWCYFPSIFRPACACAGAHVGRDHAPAGGHRRLHRLLLVQGARHQRRHHVPVGSPPFHLLSLCVSEVTSCTSWVFRTVFHSIQFANISCSVPYNRQNDTSFLFLPLIPLPAPFSSSQLSPFFLMQRQGQRAAAELAAPARGVPWPGLVGRGVRHPGHPPQGTAAGRRRR